MTSLALLLVCPAGTACTQPNPAFDLNSQTSTGGSDTALAGSSSEPGTSGSPLPTGSGGATGTGSATGTDGTSDTSDTSVDTTGPAAPTCGNRLVEPGEDCDDGNPASDDGCLACAIPETCAEILALAPESQSGTYLIDPGGSGEPWPVTCDMDKEGGGWTGFTVQDTCNGHLESEVVGLKVADMAGIDADCRPFTEYPSDGNYIYYWDIQFPPGFSAFFLREYMVKGIGDVELKYQQVLWTQANEFPNGALSLGDAHDDGPITNWATDGGMIESFFDGQILPYPVQELPFALGQSSDALRIGWGEAGINHEGLYPWWSGQIFVR